LALATLLLAAGAQAAAPKSISIDRSGSSLIDAATSEKLWKANTPARVAKLYPTRKFRFVSEITGGFNEAKNCIVSARAMLLPVVYLPIQGTKVIYEPIKSASAAQSRCAPRSPDRWPAGRRRTGAPRRARPS
jgi:hypothetical protein